MPDVLARSGRPLEHASRAGMEAWFGHDFAQVRLHHDGPAAASAAALGARAYTVGSHVVFGAGQYAPGTAAGERLLAHELVHTIQQAGAEPALHTQLEVSRPGDPAEVEADRLAGGAQAGPVTQRCAPHVARNTTDEDAWKNLHPAYKTPRTANLGPSPATSVERYRSRIGLVEPRNNQEVTPAPEYKAASGWDTHADKMPDITLEPTDIYFIVGENLDTLGQLDVDKVRRYLENLAVAFRVAKLDTVEAQALYLAHAAGETRFAFLTEGQDQKDPAQAFQNKPDTVRIMADPKGPLRYNKTDTKEDRTNKRSILPLGDLDVHKNASGKGTFVGRGPIQVTHDYNYVKTLIYMEQMAKKATGGDKALLQRAIVAIKADPTRAADPEFSFLFSAAYMHVTGGARASAIVGAAPTFDGLDPASSWVAGGGSKVTGDQAKRAARKAAAFKRAVERLKQKQAEWKRKQP